MKPMRLTPAHDIPAGADWVYELKYDGFRAILVWEEDGIRLESRTGKRLNKQFPEVMDQCEQLREQFAPFLPLTLDGELVFLLSEQQSEFAKVQQRGRLKNKEAIQRQAERFPCHFITFDLLSCKGKPLVDSPLMERKNQLQQLFQEAKLPSSVQLEHPSLLQVIHTDPDSEYMKNVMTTYLAEGLVAKKKSSKWHDNTRSKEWLKMKNWRYVSVIVTRFDKENGYFQGSIYQDSALIEVVQFKHGFSKEEEQTLRTLFQTKGQLTGGSLYEIPPSIVASIACISFDGSALREPRFSSFLLDADPAACTFQQMLKQLYPLPAAIDVTHPEKPIVPALQLNKADYLLYLRQAAPYLLPFLRERRLTLIRYPHGTGDEFFYQKSTPDYAPDFVLTDEVDDISYTVCNDPRTLLWLGNQLAMEFHIPFETRDTDRPTEIVFDLDPPSVNEFHLAIEAAKRIKTLLDGLYLTAFIKTSGGKGLQVYIPLKKNAFTYEETRQFTAFICQFLCEQAPDLFTLERLKKKRGNRLYLDYIQHDAGKTIIAPYSPRGNELGLVATPLEWDELYHDELHPSLFTMPAVIERLKEKGDPFRRMRHLVNDDAFRQVLHQLAHM
ncbi:MULTISPECIES: DNA ligase D [unclassified Bacillus (in: firmicutes)]|uniref:DNA ligase D n=1 Tax=unclassified Bacillus (in: firmicutes) TaxID=185979 RepID=UPI00163C7DA8|nr:MULTISPECIES: DNA ligase D [unclassified Bacillus (in: firmicutes)]QNH49290.1 DNA ligase D [Bacillus sp. PAMC28571]QNK43584.1 DNA ligase D [Bacillus sp. PAMC22265]